MKTALLDGDIIAYHCAAWAASRNMDGVDMLDRVDFMVQDWARRAGCEELHVMLSCPRDENFRRKFWPTYKAHRDGHEDPPGRADCIAQLRSNWGAISRPHIEADDLLGILATSKWSWAPVIVTIDKDLGQIPGWHFNPDKDTAAHLITADEADRFFHQQWMSGDPTDNIPGIPGIGPVKAAKLLAGCADSAARTRAVLAAYKAKGKTRADATDMMRCVRILRTGEWDIAKQKPILWKPSAP
jgi:hypothetical protein